MIEVLNQKMEKQIHIICIDSICMYSLIVVASKLCLNLQVSHTYSKEVAGNPLIAPHLHKFHGILNGIDPDIWDPYNDKFIPVSGFLSLSLSHTHSLLFFCQFLLPIEFSSLHVQQE